MKKCSCCGAFKLIDEFQVRRASADGRTASCRACLSARDKARDSDERRAARRAYQATPRGQDRHLAANNNYRRKNPLVVRAHNAVNKAVQRGEIAPWPCEICGEKAEAHHPHYGAPLLVVWLCDADHKQAHAETIELEQRQQLQ